MVSVILAYLIFMVCELATLEEQYPSRMQVIFCAPVHKLSILSWLGGPYQGGGGGAHMRPRPEGANLKVRAVT